MKKILLSFLVFALFSYTFGQNSAIKLFSNFNNLEYAKSVKRLSENAMELTKLDSIIVDFGVFKQIIHYGYDNHGHQTYEFADAYFNGVFDTLESSKTYYHWEDGLLQSKAIHKVRNGVFKLVDSTKNSFEDGVLVDDSKFRDSAGSMKQYEWNLYMYNDDGGVDSVIGFFKTLTSQMSTMSVYSYSNNLVDSVVHQSSMDGDTWIVDNVKKYVYNSNGKLIKIILKDLQDSILTNDEMSELLYNDNGDVEYIMSYYWDNENNIWVKNEKQIPYHDDAVDNIELLYPYSLINDDFASPLLNHKLDSVDVIDYDEGDSVSGKVNLHYSSYVGISNQTTENVCNIQVYPNPAVNYVKVITKGVGELRLYDQLGNLMISMRIVDKQVLDLSDYSSGIYLIQVEANNEVKSQKLILRR